MIIQNPNFDKSLVWKLDKSKLQQQNVFSITPHEGVIEPQQKTDLIIGFQPSKAEKLEEKIRIYFENMDEANSKEIVLRGEGAYPKLLFEVDEIILDVVPLNH
jgi:hypothetical protein